MLVPNESSFKSFRIRPEMKSEACVLWLLCCALVEASLAAFVIHRFVAKSVQCETRVLHKLNEETTNLGRRFGFGWLHCRSFLHVNF